MKRKVLCALAAMMLSSSSSFADNTEEGRRHFQRGVQFFKEQDFRGALIEFKRAYEVAPNYKVLYNLGQTSLELQDYAAALSAFRRYLDEGGNDIPQDRQKQVQAEIKKLEGRVARVTVRTNVEGADVLVDDVVVGKTPLASPLVVSAGRRKIAVSKAGSPPQSRAIDVAGGDETTVDLEIAEPTTQVVTQPPPSGENNPPAVVIHTAPAQAPSSGGGISAPTVIGIITTGTLAVGTIVMGSLALVSKSQFDDALNTPGAAAKIADARDKTRTFAVATDIVGATTIAAGIVTLVLAFTTKSSPKHEGARFDVGPTGASLFGSF